eukprot:10032285-Alexandrium_andersonii.AAC.1
MPNGAEPAEPDLLGWGLGPLSAPAPERRIDDLRADCALLADWAEVPEPMSGLRILRGCLK